MAKIDPDLLSAFHAGAAAVDEGASYKANPHYYTSAMSDAWAMGHALAYRAELASVAKVLGFSSRGMLFQHVNGGLYRYRVSYITCTAGHDVWRAAA